MTEGYMNPIGWALSASLIALGSTTALAQQDASSETGSAMPGTGSGDMQVAEQCLQDLVAFNETMREDGYWISGWGSRWAYGPRPIAPVATPPAVGNGDAAAATDGDTSASESMATVGPWAGPRWGMTSPRFQIGTLHTAANILAHRGDQDGCSATLAELKQIYDGYVGELQAAGVHPTNVTSWRQERIIAAKPISEVTSGSINIADVTGTDVRNAHDEQLGTVEDVILDLQSGAIQYVVVSTDGFLGFGDEHVAVPWDALKSTPGLNTFVLDVSEQVMEQAPKVDPNRFGDPARAETRRQQVDQFWDEHAAG